MVRDFSHRAYRTLLESLLGRGYVFCTFRDISQHREPEGLHVLLRHDVDRFPFRALEMARIEDSLGVEATYFFRIKKPSFNAKVIAEVAGFGHEIGYHYEELSDMKGDAVAAWQQFMLNLRRFDGLTEITSIAMHGRPLSKWDNRDLWKYYDYRELGVTLEAYLDIDWSKYIYFTDVGRCWNSSLNIRDKVNNPLVVPERGEISKTEDLSRLFDCLNHNAVLSIHPERWAKSFIGWSQAYCFDIAANIVKGIVRRCV